MTRNRILLLILVVACGVGVVLIKQDHSSSTSATSAPLSKNSKQVVNIEKLQINGQKVLGLVRGKEKEEIKKIKVANTPSPEWKENLEETLLTQGGGGVKDLKIEKVDSFVWTKDGVALFVESVIVKLKNEANESTSFRLLVDAQSGKILGNWDQPVIDPVNPHDDLRVKVDPSYESR